MNMFSFGMNNNSQIINDICSSDKNNININQSKSRPYSDIPVLNDLTILRDILTSEY